MQNNNLNLIKQIELIHEYISDECQEYIYYVPKGSNNVSQKIINASSTLVNNAMRILRNQKPLLYDENAKPLTLEQIKNMMFKIYQVVLTAKIPVKKENILRKILKEDFAINPDNLLQPNPSMEREEYKIAMLLNHGL